MSHSTSQSYKMKTWFCMVHTNDKSCSDFAENIWHIYLHCDIQVILYWLGFLSQAGENSNLHIRTARHLIGNASGSNLATPPHILRNLPFCPFLPFASLSPAVPTFFHNCPLPDPVTRMPAKPGPWQLDRVKRRLRQEQIAREEAASERYRDQEERVKVRRNTNLDEQRLTLQERNLGGCHCAVIVLVCVLVFLLLVIVLVLCAFIFHLLKKGNAE